MAFNVHVLFMAFNPLPTSVSLFNIKFQAQLKTVPK